MIWSKVLFIWKRWALLGRLALLRELDFILSLHRIAIPSRRAKHDGTNHSNLLVLRWFHFSRQAAMMRQPSWLNLRRKFPAILSYTRKRILQNIGPKGEILAKRIALLGRWPSSISMAPNNPRSPGSQIRNRLQNEIEHANNQTIFEWMMENLGG